jgi:hypothetical protein
MSPVDSIRWPFQILGQLGILLDVVLERHLTVVADELFEAMVLLAPGVVVDIVLVIPRFGHRHLEEVRVDQHGGGRHEPAA